MPIPVELLRFFDKFTPPAPAGEQKSAEDSASLADFGDAAVAEAEADAELGSAAAPLEIPDIPPIPELVADVDDALPADAATRRGPAGSAG
jgi:hypothetical protein